MLILFFIGAGVWVYQTFATKCYLEAGFVALNAQTKKQQNTYDLKQKRLEIQILENLQVHVIDLKDNLRREELLRKLEEEYRDLAEQDTNFSKTIEQAYKRCTFF